ncbi:F-box protein At5g07610-like [Andrographis paniculata]|uniref:F-box protein At5g07610-like n=1 Tax=Andrographis paniculata TaxID=175694 RepID=UPI0021E93F28|nr:F-box protein At5g07610-like [Andrographis paniculata]
MNSLHKKIPASEVCREYAAGEPEIQSDGEEFASQAASQSASVIAANEDLIALVLLRLPLKPLVRFKCVSKQWLSMISDPFFTRRKNAELCGNASGLYVFRRNFLHFKPEYDVVPLNEDVVNSSSPAVARTLSSDENQPIKILQSCNGLLCCRNGGLKDGKYSYYVCNPTTRRCVRLPDPLNRAFTVNDGSESVYAVNLAFDPRKSPHFKAVCVYFCETVKYRFVMDMYSSETGIWKRVGDPLSGEINFHIGVFWNGAINWFSLCGDGLYFNLEEERFGKLPMPPIPDGWEERRIRYFGESNNHLHLVEIYGPCTTEFNVYEMDEDYRGWKVTYRVDIEPVMNAFPESISSWLGPSRMRYYKYLILSIIRRGDGGGGDSSFVVVNIPGKAIRYNLEDKSFYSIWNFTGGECDHPRGGSTLPMFGWFDAFQYIQCI